MSVETTVPITVLHSAGAALACGPAGELNADELHGFFVADTRVLSTYRMTIGGQAWRLIGRHREGHGTSTWTFENPLLRDPNGEVPPGSLFLSVRRRVSGGLHDDLTIWSFADAPVRTRLVLQLDADFADLFEVRERHLPPRLDVARTAEDDRLSLRYARNGFHRGLVVEFSSSGDTWRPPDFVGSSAAFDLALAHGAGWTCCLHAEVEVDGTIRRFVGDPHGDEVAEPIADRMPTVRADPLLQVPFEQGCADLAALSICDDGSRYIAAGVPWFMTLFARDTLITALMSGVVGPPATDSALAALAPLQARDRDDWRDAEPGKLPHEVRRGELAFRHEIPHTPYYGAHDAPALFCIALWNAWRWGGDEKLLEQYLGTAQECLRWCDELGDRDGDGLQEYATRSRRGYFNQSWKDAGDAILHVDGRLPDVPIATVELQGYLYAARLAMAELSEWRGDRREAETLRRAAADLRALVEERYWLEDEGFYAVALDGRKEPVRSITSNPGQLLWTGLPNPERATRTTQRMLERDLFSGWGLRTLSARHVRYNPLSYQRGSVWPHDNALTAAGMHRYGLRDEASVLIRAVLDAANAFEDARLPELFCGIERERGAPVPYAEANVPQAWAAATPLLVTQLFLGVVPDAPRGRCSLDPWLPEWLAKLEIDRLAIGSGTLRVVVVRDDAQTRIEVLEADGVDVVEGSPESPLWGTVSSR